MIPQVAYPVVWHAHLQRHHQIWDELQFKLKLEDHPNAISVLLRVLFELSVDNYIARAGLATVHANDKLALKAAKVGQLRLTAYGVVDRETGTLGLIDQTASPAIGRTPWSAEVMYARVLTTPIGGGVRLPACGGQHDGHRIRRDELHRRGPLPPSVLTMADRPEWAQPRAWTSWRPLPSLEELPMLTQRGRREGLHRYGTNRFPGEAGAGENSGNNSKNIGETSSANSRSEVTSQRLASRRPDVTIQPVGSAMRRGTRFDRSIGRGVRFLAPVAITIAVCLCAVEARAAVVTGMFSGVIDHGTDYAGVFGSANASLDGLNYVETFTYDTSKGFRATHPTFDQISVSGFGLEPVLTYSLTIKGITDILNLYSTTYVVAVPGDNFRLAGQAIGANVFISISDVAYGAAFGNLDDPNSFEDTMNGPGSPITGFAQKSAGSSSTVPQYYMVFDTQRVDFLGGGGLSSAPEPASWVMMLAGFLAVGAAMRLRRDRSAIALAS